jgi:hypothetical protein
MIAQCQRLERVVGRYLASLHNREVIDSDSRHHTLGSQHGFVFQGSVVAAHYFDDVVVQDLWLAVKSQVHVVTDIANVFPLFRGDSETVVADHLKHLSGERHERAFFQLA